MQALHTHLHGLVEELHDVRLLYKLSHVSIETLGQPGEEVQGDNHEVFVCCFKLTRVLCMCLRRERKVKVLRVREKGDCSILHVRA